MVRLRSVRGWLVTVALVGCGRLEFEASERDPGLPANGDVVGQMVAGARSDGSGFALAWLSHQLDGTRVWRFGAVDPTAAWRAPPVVLFEDRDFPLLGVQLVPLGENWLLMRQYEWDTVRMPVDLAVIADDGLVLSNVEDSATWFAAATIVPSSQGFGVIYHHHETQSDSNTRRQVYSRHYDLAGELVTSERDVVEVLDDQFLIAATPHADGSLVVWREETSTNAKFAVVSPTGAIIRSATIAGVNDIYWGPFALVTAGGAIFVERTAPGLRVRKVAANGSAVWSPQEQSVPLGLNRFQNRTVVLAHDLATAYVMWSRDDLTDLPLLSLAELDTSGSSPTLAEEVPLTDGITADFAPLLALAPTHVFAAWIREAGGEREIQVRVRPR
ncbi:MAG: hypothetical protein ACKV2T_05990 [Kofleriaceae bacterium]